MRSIALSVVFALLLFGIAAIWRPEPDLIVTKRQTAAPPALAIARQLLVVTTPGWNDVEGRMQRYERAEAKQEWQPVGEPVSIVVGRNGMGWGRGLHGAPPGAGPVKREGDGRTPAGIYRLSAAFGYAAPDEAQNVKLPYVQSRASIECVDDTRSTHYNRMIDRSRTTTVDWTSSEQMRRADDQYRWVVVVDHNANTPVAGAGSCIFLHIWAGPSEGTSGCTAMEAARMEESIFWLDPARGPLLVQLPEAQYNELREVWKLPVQEQKR